jgi:hypothetical protein
LRIEYGTDCNHRCNDLKDHCRRRRLCLPRPRRSPRAPRPPRRFRPRGCRAVRGPRPIRVGPG